MSSSAAARMRAAFEYREGDYWCPECGTQAAPTAKGQRVFLSCPTDCDSDTEVFITWG